MAFVAKREKGLAERGSRQRRRGGGGGGGNMLAGLAGLSRLERSQTAHKYANGIRLCSVTFGTFKQG